VGCGEGLFLKVLKDAGYNDCFGIEPGIFAQGYAEKHGLRIKQGRIEDLGELLNEEVVSVITLFHVVEHLQDPRAAIKLIHDHLPIGGHLVLETPDIDSYMIRKLDYRHPLIYPEHLFYFNEQTLCALLTDVGFSIIDSGRRDFDLPHTSIRQLLGYVGLSAQVGAGASEELCRQGSERGASSTERRPLIRRLASHMLAATVHMLNRENYIWMVARREK
jgi:SAM-dependent methyltransferase